MNKNKMLNDKPIFVAKRRIFRSLIVAAIFLMFALVIYFVSQESEADVIDWVGVGFFGIGVVFVLYETLIFKKIMLSRTVLLCHFDVLQHSSTATQRET